ncbi:MAG: B12-binding domain-containing radical SAM protein [Planctomycetes bacterium]|nr:B12-binding domain-containing radical SAM protein [Planctomycetota bacterium]MCB9903505.1 B12-binding domain-containing radical SAM protein [Planctomycetota bacterium]
MSILLAYAPHADTFGYSMPPPGLLRLGAALEAAGLDVRLDDLAFALSSGALPEGDELARAAAERLHETGADVIGLSVMGATLPIALAILDELRALGSTARRILGGPGTTGVDAALIERFPAVDAVVRGEAERGLPELLAAWSRVNDATGVAGVTWRDTTGAVRREPDREGLRDLGELPRPAWHLLPPLAAYKRVTGEADGLVPVDSGRGCVYDCSFCTIGRHWNRRSRTLPAARLVDEVFEAAALDSARNVYLCHDIFGADRAHALEFCDGMLRRGASVPWECRARVDHLDAELLERMAAAGCYRVLLGIESAASSVRERCEKRMAADTPVLERVADCARLGITPILSFILGLPGEGDAELAQTLDLAADASLRAGLNLSFHLVNPQPGCGLGEEFGAVSRPVDGVAPDMALGAGHSAAERTLIDAHPDLFSSWALLPMPLEQLEELAWMRDTLPDLLQRYPRTWALLRRALGVDSLELARRFRADGRSFAGFALLQRVPFASAALYWEQALVRSAARGELQVADAPRVLGELVALPLDVPESIQSMLRDESPKTPSRETHLFVRATPRGVLSQRVGPDVARVLALLDGRRTLTELESQAPGIGAALHSLADAGLVGLPTALESTP